MGVEYLDSFFTGKDNTLDKTKGLTYAVVMKLVEGLENKGTTFIVTTSTAVLTFSDFGLGHVAKLS